MKRFKIIFLLFNFCWVSLSLASDELTVLLDWFPNPNHAPLFVAEAKGFFRQQGLTVKLLGPADPSDPPKFVAVNKADIAIDYQPQLLLQIKNGLPLVRIGALIDRPLSCLVVNGDSQIFKPADLKGKRIGYSGGWTDSVILRVMLANANLNLSDVDYINVHYNLLQALLSHKVDATVGMLRNFELIQMELLKKTGRAFYPENFGMPSYDELIFVVNRAHIHDPRFPKFLKAVNEGVQYLRQHPEESWNLFIKLQPHLDNELNQRAWKDTMQYFPKDVSALDEKRYNVFANFMKKYGLIDEVYPVSKYAIKLDLKQE